MSLSCPSCGLKDFDPDSPCQCGYQDYEKFIVDSLIVRSDRSSLEEKKEQKTGITPEGNEIKHDEDIFIKEIDSWIFRYSEADNSVSLGTPALQSFTLMLDLTDLEELLEISYSATEIENPASKIRLAGFEIPDLIETIQKMTEEKTSDRAASFTSDELHEITEMIDTKLKE